MTVYFVRSSYTNDDMDAYINLKEFEVVELSEG